MSTPPQQSPHPAPQQTPSTADRVIAWVVWCINVVIGAIIWVLALMSVFTTDSCGAIAHEAVSVCDENVLAGMILGIVVISAATVLINLVGLIVATTRGTKAWPWSVICGVLLVLEGVVFSASVIALAD